MNYDQKPAKIQSVFLAPGNHSHAAAGAENRLWGLLAALTMRIPPNPPLPKGGEEGMCNSPLSKGELGGILPSE